MAEKLCACGSKMSWIMEFFGVGNQADHIHDCPDCGQHTLHVCDEDQECVNLNCQHHSGVDAEGNVYTNGLITSNGGRSIDQLRDEYFSNL